MKKLLFLSVLLYGVFLSSGCELLQLEEFTVSDPVISSPIPERAVEFIQANFPTHAVRWSRDEDLCDNTPVLEVELEDGSGPDVDLYFTPDGTFLFSATDISASDLPEAVLATISTEFSAYQIDDREVDRLDFPDGSIQYEVELIDASGEDHDLVLASDGSVICWEGNFPDDNGDDNDGDDDDDSTVTVPDSIRNQVMTDYPGYRISSAEREDLCDDEYFFKIELEDGNGPDVDLYYSLTWVFKFTATDLNLADLPTAVTDALAINHPAYSIDPEKVERLDYPDGTLTYSLELETANGSDLDVIYDAAGNLVCQDADSDDDDDDDDDDDNENNSSSLPDSVRAFITGQYPGYRIDHVEREDLCDDDYYFKVELEDGNGPDLELYFTLSWEFYLEAEEISPRDVPVTVTSVLEADYPGAIIEEAERQTYADGTIAYYLEIETASRRNEKITYAADGTLVCRED